MYIIINMYTHIYIYTLIGFHDQQRADALLDEALCMKSLDHPNVLTLIGVCMDALSTPCIVMPYMANGSLLAHLRRTSDNLSVNSCEQRLVRDLIYTNHYTLHKCKISKVRLYSSLLVKTE